MFRGTLTSCTREELVARCREARFAKHARVDARDHDRRPGGGVAIPARGDSGEHPQVHPRQRDQVAWLFLVLYGLPMLIPSDRRSAEYRFLAQLLSFAILPLADGWWELRQSRRETPETAEPPQKHFRALRALDRSPAQRGHLDPARDPASPSFSCKWCTASKTRSNGRAWQKTGPHPSEAFRFLTRTH